MMKENGRGARRYYVVTVALSLLVGVTAKSAVEISPVVLALRKTEKPDIAGCRQVQKKTLTTCYKAITTKEAYACPQTQLQDASTDGRAGTANVHTSNLITRSASQCAKTRLERQCRSVPGTCYRREKQKREYPCLGREICSIAPTEVEGTCLGSPTQEAYPCEKQKVDRVCTDVEVVVDKVCHRDEARTVQYPCKKTEIQRACHSVEAQALSSEICFRNVTRTEEYACSKTEMQKVCSQEPVELGSTCTRVVPIERQSPCTRKVAVQKCKNGITKRSALCSRTVRVPQAYECGEVQNRTECVAAAEPTCKDKKCKMRRLHPVSCHKASLGRSRTCYKEVDQVQEYPCATGSAVGCEIVEEEIADTCTDTTSHEETYACTKVEYREKCEEVPVEVPATCQREVTAQEAYPCPVVQQQKAVCEHQPVEVEDTCQKQVTVQAPYTCQGLEVRTQCKNETVTYQETCYRTVPAQEYPCTNTEMKRQCIQEQKMCSEKVFAEVPYECSRTVCEYVQVPVDKTRHMSSFRSTRLEDQCPRQLVSEPRTCFRDVVAQKPFPCYKTSVITVCKAKSSHVPSVQG